MLHTLTCQSMMSSKLPPCLVPQYYGSTKCSCKPSSVKCWSTNSIKSPCVYLLRSQEFLSFSQAQMHSSNIFVALPRKAMQTAKSCFISELAGMLNVAHFFCYVENNWQYYSGKSMQSLPPPIEWGYWWYATRTKLNYNRNVFKLSKHRWKCPSGVSKIS